ncbi:MFS transporter [Gilvimarinus sp. F26214L]|uniref:MFS transporter n=1 Tax=Gilvimarinus sp. DZF01 TaxID=3461371 RepID=UPI0040465027
MTESRRFYGWIIVAVAFFVDFIAVGFFFYSYAVFLLPIAEELGGGSRLAANGGLALVHFVAGCLGPFVGNALDRYPIKRIMTLGACMSAAGFFALSLVQNMVQFYLALLCLTAVGTATMGQLATAKLVSNWFIAKRGTALGIATMGVSLSGAIMPFVTTWLIDAFGWRGAFEIFSLLTLVLVVPMVLLYVVNDPEQIGQEPDGRRRLPVPDQPRVPPPQPTSGDILRMPTFWAITLAFGALFTTLGATLTNTIALARDLGFAGYWAAAILPIGALAGVAGKVYFGVLSDRVDIRLAIVLTVATQGTGIAMLIFVEQYWLLALASAIFGFGMGGAVPLHAAAVASFFGRRGFGKMMGLMRATMLPLQLLGMPLAGWAYDATGTYDTAFGFFIGLLVAAGLIAWFMFPRERTAE